MAKQTLLECKIIGMVKRLYWDC